MTENSFDMIVVGAGMMGSAAARHLAEAGIKTALVGPSEPAQKRDHDGVFASHYDAARITRQIDARRNWGRFSQAAIKRYGEIAAKGKQDFFAPVGALIAGPESGAGSDFINNARCNAAADGIAHEVLRAEQLARAFPDFAFPQGILALYEPSQAGWIDPRAHLQAEINAALTAGAQLVRTTANAIRENDGGAHVHCANGDVLTAGGVVVACGAFSNAEGLLPAPLPLKVYARTIAFFELDPKEAARLSHMPSVVYMSPDGSSDPYILPPVRYPDGKFYIKIGGDAVDRPLNSTAEMIDWFRSEGDPIAGAATAEILIGLMPDLRYRAVSFGSCATSFSPSGNPFIYRQTECVTVLAAGNGAGAKCADELGRLGALVAAGGVVPDEIYEGLFAP